MSVGGAVDPRARPPETMKKEPLIVLLTDFSDASYDAFEPARELATRLGGRIALVHVVQELMAIPHGAPLAPPVSMPPDHVDALMRQAWKDMEEAKVELGGEPAADVLTGSSVHEAIHRYADEHGADFVALATHGRTGLRRVVMGSVAEQILRHSDVPVILFPLGKEK